MSPIRCHDIPLCRRGDRVDDLSLALRSGDGRSFEEELLDRSFVAVTRFVVLETLRELVSVVES